MLEGDCAAAAVIVVIMSVQPSTDVSIPVPNNEELSAVVVVDVATDDDIFNVDARGC